MSEVVILDEMLQAGIEAYLECRKRKMQSAETCVAIYLAMRCLEEMAAMDDEKQSVH